LSPALADPLRIAADILDPPPWEPKDRPPLEEHQIPPQEIFDLWLLEAGRGAGKTEACSRYFAAYMRAHPGYRGRIIAPTYGDAVEACIEGPSGLLSVDPELHWMPSAPGGSKIVWPNGSEALVLGTYAPRDVDRLRAGGNRHLDWWEEMAANPQLEAAWDQAAFGLRLGPHPHAIASTTPRNTSAYMAIRKDKEMRIARTHATIWDNPHLSDEWKARQVARHEGTRLGRQELMGELIEDVEGALWTRKMIEAGRVSEADCPDLALCEVAVDPAAASGPESDDTGIVGGGIGVDGEVYILADRTCHLPPDGWGTRAVRLYKQLKADGIVGEVNNGGEMVEHVIQTVNPRVPFFPVHASRGKATRAQPVAALYGSNPPGKRAPKIHHVGFFPELEDQMCTWVPDEGDPSPDRMDALVWLATHMLLEEEEEHSIQEEWTPTRIGADL
jgi:phage terminase large subunit-like protein